MKVLVTGSSGHLGEALTRTLELAGDEVVGLDLKPGDGTTQVGSVADGRIVRQCLQGVDVVYHTATLHKPHIATHIARDFVDTNVSGTLALLEAAVAAGVRVFIFTSTTSVFGNALQPGPGEPAVWVTEDLSPIPKNIYGVTKAAAEDLCELFHRQHGLSCVILRTSRFFPEEDDDPRVRAAYTDRNIKANEFLFRRVDIQDVVDAHLLAAQHSSALGFGMYIISATTPFLPEDLLALRGDPASVVECRVPGFLDCYAKEQWGMFNSIDRVYVNVAARCDLEWQPRYDIHHVLACIRRGESFTSPLGRSIGSKGYHERRFADGPYPVR